MSKEREVHRLRREMVGKTGLYQIPVKYLPNARFRVRVKVLAVRGHFGRNDALVQPTDGEGQAWVNIVSLELDQQQAPAQVPPETKTPEPEKKACPPRGVTVARGHYEM